VSATRYWWLIRGPTNLQFPLLIIIPRVAWHHVHLAPILLALTGIQTEAMHSLDLQSAGVILPLLVLICSVTVPHVHLAPPLGAFTGIQALIAVCSFDLLRGWIEQPMLVFVYARPSAIRTLPRVNLAPVIGASTSIQARAFVVIRRTVVNLKLDNTIILAFSHKILACEARWRLLQGQWILAETSRARPR